MDKTLQKYVHKFSTLRQGTGGAPHKPVLLLSVLRGIDEGWITGNRIELSPELVGTFKTIWQSVVITGHSPLIALPFFHMRNEKFWHLIPLFGFESWVQVTRKCQSLSVLNQTVAYVQLDPELFALASSSAHRAILKQTLLEKYFPAATASAIDSSSYWNKVSNQILAESSAEYQAEIQSLQETLDKNSFEEEVFVRSEVFKRQVPLVYSNTCCISGLRVETSINASLIDACHIVPFSQSHDDTISNGLSLCPTLHRAFDRGLIAIDPDNYQVMVSKRLSEPVASAYSILQFAGRQMQLPENNRFRPGRGNLQDHLSRYVDNF